MEASVSLIAALASDFRTLLESYKSLDPDEISWFFSRAILIYSTDISDGSGRQWWVRDSLNPLIGWNETLGPSY